MKRILVRHARPVRTTEYIKSRFQSSLRDLKFVFFQNPAVPALKRRAKIIASLPSIFTQAENDHTAGVRQIKRRHMKIIGPILN
jgi:hypothetical protein